LIIKDVGFLIAFWGGFSSFFTLWQLCLMQITPFFLAFAIGVYLIEDNSELHTANSSLSALLLACAGYILGFSIVFALMGTSGWGAASYIVYNIDDFRTAAAIYITIIALLMALYNFYGSRAHSLDRLGMHADATLLGRAPLFRILYLPAGLLLGAAFALAYSPCIPPVMSDIMNFAGKPGNAHKGFHLLAVYGFGVTLAFSISGAVLAILAGYFTERRSVKVTIAYLSSGTLFLMALLIFTDLMIRYKSFLVGLVLD
jgi:cytochrome c-type biogenesis protein